MVLGFFFFFSFSFSVCFLFVSVSLVLLLSFILDLVCLFVFFPLFFFSVCVLCCCYCVFVFVFAISLGFCLSVCFLFFFFSFILLFFLFSLAALHVLCALGSPARGWARASGVRVSSRGCWITREFTSSGNINWHAFSRRYPSHHQDPAPPTYLQAPVLKTSHHTTSKTRKQTQPPAAGCLKSY